MAPKADLEVQRRTEAANLPGDADFARWVDAALAATVFHSGQIPIPELKRTLAVAGIEVRPC